eukprot:tig00020830_g14487.t1
MPPAVSDFVVTEMEFGAEAEISDRYAAMQLMHGKDFGLDELADPEELPPSYSTHTEKELRTFDYIEQWRREFVEQYPERRELLLTPLNECRIKKFVCTTIRPTQLAYSELYDYERCARFLADFITYTPLHDPVRLPSYVFSPTFVVKTQRADCFDFATLLCSYLLGVGYDAYCVSGYAPKHVTMCDQSEDTCPVLEPKEEKQEKKGDEGAENGKYRIPARPVLQSKFERAAEEKARREMEEALAKRPEPEPGPVDELENVRVHCWVLIQAGKREVPEHVFIEPSTGRVYPVHASPYRGIESVWNNANYWVNMQQGVPLENLSYELHDLESWEYVFVDPFSADTERAAAAAEEEVLTGDHGAGSKALAKENPEAAALAAEDVQLPEVPPPWAARVKLTRDAYVKAFSKGSKVNSYSRVKLELFADYAREDGMVSRLTVFDDDEGLDPVEVREEFRHRRDKLSERRRFPKEARHVESFAAGRSHGLREIVVIEGQKRELNFYPSARLDGLVQRVETFGRKTVEVFTERDDRLVYRSVTYEGSDKWRGDTADLTIKKMTEKYSRNRAIDAESDIAKRTYYMTQGRIRVEYHTAPGRITASSREYSKDGRTDINSVDPFAREPKKPILLEDYQRVLHAEKECQQAVRESERESKDIYMTRMKEEQAIVLVISPYEVFRRKKDEKELSREAEAEAEAKTEKDYLWAFLPDAAKQGKPLNRDAALKVKDGCLKALKERLIERANIIQSRLDEENSNLLKRQNAYQRNRDHLDKNEEEEYERYCQDAAFRIQILDQRLKRHEEQALLKYTEMDRRLREDPRLQAVHQA